MKRHLCILFLLFSILLSYGQGGPNRTFCKFKEVKDPSGVMCKDNCATIVLIYEKGTYLNAIKAAMGIDSVYAIATEKSYYVEYKIEAGVHKIYLPQGVWGGVDNFVNVMDTFWSDNNFIIYHIESNYKDYEIQIGSDVTDVHFNLRLLPCDSKMFMHEVSYFTCKRDFKPGSAYYYKSIKLPDGTSLACGPIITETTKEDFEKIIAGDKIKEKGELILYKNVEK